MARSFVNNDASRVAAMTRIETWRVFGLFAFPAELMKQ
jgi:hypothetical protein